MNENKMNNDKAGEINNQEQDPQIFIKLHDNEVIQFPLSKFNDMLESKITEYINKTDNKNIIKPKELVNVKVWEKKFKKLSHEAKELHFIVEKLEKDLMKDKFAQPRKCCIFDFTQNVDISLKKMKRGIVCENSINDHEIFTIFSNSEGKSIITTDSSKTKRKPGLKSKTMIVDDMISSNSNNKELDGKKMCLNKDINGKTSKTTNLSNFNSSKKKLEVTKNPNLRLKFLRSKYPPPYPLVPPYNSQPSWKKVPSIPNMSIKVSGNKVTLTWNMNLVLQTAKIKMYELFVCQETDAYPDISMWKKKENIKAEMLPMACKLKVYELGYIYYFALRAVDDHNRRAPFAVQKAKI